MKEIKLDLKPEQARSFVVRFQQVDTLHAQINELATFLASGADIQGQFVVAGLDTDDPQAPKLVLHQQEPEIVDVKPLKKK